MSSFTRLTRILRLYIRRFFFFPRQCIIIALMDKPPLPSNIREMHGRVGSWWCSGKYAVCNADGKKFKSHSGEESESCISPVQTEPLCKLSSAFIQVCVYVHHQSNLMTSLVPHYIRWVWTSTWVNTFEMHFLVRNYRNDPWKYSIVVLQ